VVRHVVLALPLNLRVREAALPLLRQRLPPLLLLPLHLLA
jgi:hypothetical protein